MLPIAGSTSFRKYQPDHPILLHISCYFPTRLQAIIATKLVYNFKVKSYLFPRNIIPSKKNVYIFYQKCIYLLPKKYILFTQNVYTFHRKVYTFLQNYNYILQTTEYQTLNSIRFCEFCH
ncbi:hypothetical protein HMPREF9419_0129 [Prevotella nigrescens ATCC 33563]|nr:hypothetical protein HMPREF9419_0129 [Prevotella nigrescens ATCC 33563]